MGLWNGTSPQTGHQGVDQQQRNDLCDPRSRMSSHLRVRYLLIARPCSRIMPSGTGRKPVSLADMAAMLLGVHR